MKIEQLKSIQSQQLSKQEKTEVKGKGGSLIMVDNIDP